MHRRYDFADKALSHPALCELLQSRTPYVPPLALADLVDAIKRPAELPGVALSFDDRLVTEIAFDVNDRTGALPQLQFALDELFRRRESRSLTRAGYEVMGRIEGALAKRADAVYAALTPDQQAITQHIFLELVQLGEDSENTRRRVLLNDVATARDADEVLCCLPAVKDISTDPKSRKLGRWLSNAFGVLVALALRAKLKKS